MTELWTDLLPAWAVPFASAALAAALVVAFMGVSALMYIWAERKVSGRMQDRLGPTRTGPFGLLQSLADGIKLLTKEDLTPVVADVFLFKIAPYLAFCASFAGFLALPFATRIVGVELNIAAFFVLAILASEVFGVLLAGYASGNKWALFGGVREAAQVVSYEVPRSLCVLVPICITGTLNLETIAAQQAGGFHNWNIFHDPFTAIAFLIFFITATASCKRAPFDLAEAESELVAGFHTEYSGMRWSFFFLAEYGSMFAVSGLAAILFLGGRHTGIVSGEAVEHLGLWGGTALDVFVFVGKATMLVLVMMWMRWSLPRLRIDQVMTTCLKYFTPIACGLLVGVCLWQIFVPAEVGRFIAYTLAGASLVGGIALFAAAWFGEAKRPTLEGAWSR